MKRALLFVLTLLCGANVAGAPAGTVPSAEFLRELQKRSFATWTSRSEQEILELYDPGADVVLYGPQLARFVGAQGHVSFLLSLVRDWQFCEFVPTGEPFVVAGRDLASTATTWRLEGVTRDGRPVTYEGRWTNVWVRKGGRWLIAHEHVSFTSFPAVASSAIQGTPVPRLPGLPEPSRLPLLEQEGSPSSTGRLSSAPLIGLVLSVVAILLCGWAVMAVRKQARGSLLGMAAARSRGRLVGLLLRIGLRVESVDGLGRTPLMMAAKAGKVDICQRLLAAGARVDAQDEYGATALHHAAVGGDLATVALLLESGADPLTETPMGRTAADIAALLHQERISDLLASATAAAGGSQPRPALDRPRSPGPQRIRGASCPRCSESHRLVLSRSYRRWEVLVRRVLPLEFVRCPSCLWRGALSKRSFSLESPPPGGVESVPSSDVAPSDRPEPMPAPAPRPAEGGKLHPRIDGVSCPKCGAAGGLVLSRSRRSWENAVRSLLPLQFVRCHRCRWRGPVHMHRRGVSAPASLGESATPGGSRPERTSWPGSLIVVLVALALVDLFLLVRLFPPLTTDEVYFKGTAYHLATTGRWANPFVGLAGNGPGDGLVPYPPLFMVALAGWFKLFGLGGYQNHAFVLLLHWMTALLAGVLTLRLVETRRGLWASMAAIGAFCYYRLDRTDVLAGVLVLASVLLLLESLDGSAGHGSRARPVLLLGLLATFLVGPAATLLYGAVLSVFVIRSGLAWVSVRSLLLQLASCALLAVASSWALSAETFSTLARQILGAVATGLRHPFRLTGAFSWSDAVFVPWFVALGIALLLSRRTPAGADRSRRAVALAEATIFGVLVWLLLTPKAGTYLHLLLPLAVVAVVAITAGLFPRARLAPVAIALGCLLPGLLLALLTLARATTIDDRERYSSAAKAVEKYVPAGELVAGDGCLWTVFAGRNPFVDAGWAPHAARDARWIVSTGIGTGRAGLSVVEARPGVLRGGEEVVFDGILREPQRISGIPLGRSRLGYGIRIYRSPAAPDLQRGSAARAEGTVR